MDICDCARLSQTFSFLPIKMADHSNVWWGIVFVGKVFFPHTFHLTLLWTLLDWVGYDVLSESISSGSPDFALKTAFCKRIHGNDLLCRLIESVWNIFFWLRLKLFDWGYSCRNEVITWLHSFVAVTPCLFINCSKRSICVLVHWYRSQSLIFVKLELICFCVSVTGSSYIIFFAMHVASSHQANHKWTHGFHRSP